LFIYGKVFDQLNDTISATYYLKKAHNAELRYRAAASSIISHKQLIDTRKVFAKGFWDSLPSPDPNAKKYLRVPVFIIGMMRFAIFKIENFFQQQQQ
jgi:hypothetical protein